MNRRVGFSIAPVVLLVAVTAAQAQYSYGRQAPIVLKFSTMVGVSGAFLAPSDIRGVIGDDLPWIARSIKGQLMADGRLTVKVKGLVFPNSPSVPPELRGINDEPQFQAIVSCLTDDGQGGLVTVNQTSAAFPATTSGNANIATRVTLPSPCVAPMVFVVGGISGKWFAMSGANTAGY